ncbi:uncharacterized protein LOC115357246 [Myripristis murdjan]|uniref:uncharacterized protein LOC115357246 n=1 Tax=Myripristis murdjan TaxID=586833 RepID=UPI00117601FE|nr:uncharacterized protein LOC115357246 [Myripristis murdjan]
MAGSCIASTMASTLLILLLLVSLASASHYYGGHSSFEVHEGNSRGTFQVEFHNKVTFDGCGYSHYWRCYSGNCGSQSRQSRGTIDSSTNAPPHNRQWCETETVQTRFIPSDKPFQMRVLSCCWVPTVNYVGSWRLSMMVDLGKRSDTQQPNMPPDIGTLPLLRVPRNCPRSYRLMVSDPDGDRVRCRYGTVQNECSRCSQPAGFRLNEVG